MNWEAFVVIGAVTLILGLVLYGLGRLLLRWHLLKYPERRQSPRMTKAGIVLFGLMITVWLLGFGWAFFNPTSWFGIFLNSGLAFYAYTFLVAILFAAIAYVLEARGISFVAKNNAVTGRGDS